MDLSSIPSEIWQYPAAAFLFLGAFASWWTQRRENDSLRHRIDDQSRRQDRRLNESEEHCQSQINLVRELMQSQIDRIQNELDEERMDRRKAQDSLHTAYGTIEAMARIRTGLVE